MSLLNELRARRHILKPTTTTVTCADGRRFQETKSDECVALPRASCGFVVDTNPDNVPAKVADYLYLGSQDCCDMDVLKRFEIGYVLSVGIGAPVVCDDVVYKFVQCLDLPETNLSLVLEECVQLIAEAVQRQSNVLVHCNAGVSRSAAIVIGYLMIEHGLGFDAAYSRVKSARSCVGPNKGFVEQLKEMNSK